jgi:hypothetical protein
VQTHERSANPIKQVQCYQHEAKKGKTTMKWNATYAKVALLLGTLASFLLAAGADGKWG